MFDRQSLLNIGGFDPSWYHAEDMEVSLKLIVEGGTIVYTPEAVVNHVPETGLKRFLNKRKRDARAHVRIHRRYKRVGHDFIGSSWIVLSMLPLSILGACGILLYLMNLSSYESLNYDSIYYSLTREILLVIFVPLYWLISFIRSDLPKKGIYSKIVLFAWSAALWQGIILGYLDALLRKNGH
jgi:cellulose synthase/poly-beta-1,6-N-acetylglucosamine synthase-like glycosyltransferase